MQLREVKDKIVSVGNIAKITKALEAVSAAKMRKAQALALDSRPFAREIIRILQELEVYQKNEEGLDLGLYKRFFENKKEDLKTLAVVLGTDKGFCGAFNTNLLRFASQKIKELSDKEEIEIFPIGKKAIDFFKKENYKIKAEFSGIGDYGEIEEIRPLAIKLFGYFNKKEFDKIILFYNHFNSVFFQKPTEVQILPIDRELLGEILESVGGRVEEDKTEYLIEPSPETFFDLILPQLVEFELYHLVLEANASEHSARMMAMRNASENSEEILRELSLEHNKARQNQITLELSEITTAKEAME